MRPPVCATLPVPLTDLVPGEQTVTITGDRDMAVANVNVVLIAAAYLGRRWWLHQPAPARGLLPDAGLELRPRLRDDIETVGFELLADLEAWQGGAKGQTIRVPKAPRLSMVAPSIAWKWIALSVA